MYSSLLGISLVPRGVGGALRLILSRTGRVSATPHVCLHSKQSPCESKPIPLAEEISQALCASALETQSRGRSRRGWEASTAVTCSDVTHERVSPSGQDAGCSTVPPLLLLLLWTSGSSSFQRCLSRWAFFTPWRPVRLASGPVGVRP